MRKKHLVYLTLALGLGFGALWTSLQVKEPVKAEHPTVQKEQVKEEKINYTVDKFLKDYKDKPQEEIDRFFDGFGDGNRIIAKEEPGDVPGTVGYAYLSSLVEETDDPELLSDKATTYGELKKALQEYRKTAEAN